MRGEELGKGHVFDCWHVSCPRGRVHLLCQGVFHKGGGKPQIRILACVDPLPYLDPSVGRPRTGDGNYGALFEEQ